MNIFGLGLPELIIIALVVLLFFGKDRLPGLFRSIGTSIKELKDGLSTDTTKTESTTTTTPTVTTSHDAPADPTKSND